MMQNVNPVHTNQVHTRRRWLLAIPAVLAAGIILHDVAIRVIDRLPRPVAAQAPQPSPASGIALLRGGLQRDGTAIPGARLEPDDTQIRFINRRLPLNPIPYTWAGNRASLDGDTARGTRLYEAARRQDPRSTAVRFALARQYLADGRMDEAAREIFAAAELHGSAAELMMSVVRAASNQPDFRQAVLDIVAERPQRAESFYRYLQYGDVSEPLSLAMIRRFPPTGSNARRILPTLVQDGHVAEALAVWRLDEGLEPDAPVGWPRNPGFERDFANGVFSWRDTTSENGRVARVRPSAWGDRRALAATFSGGKAENLLLQTAAMRPGQYHWAIPYRIELSEGEDITLEWAVRCNGGAELDSASVTPASRTEGRLVLSFTVPGGNSCRTQEITLRGRSGDRLADLDVQFRGFEPARRSGQ